LKHDLAMLSSAQWLLKHDLAMHSSAQWLLKHDLVYINSCYRSDYILPFEKDFEAVFEKKVADKRDSRLGYIRQKRLVQS
jgi:hypothetical protein